MIPEPILSIGSFSIYMYGVMIGLGVLGTFIVLFTYGKKCGLGEKFLDFTFYNGIATVAFGFFSAMLFQAIYNYIDNPEAGFDLCGMYADFDFSPVTESTERWYVVARTRKVGDWYLCEGAR